MDTLIVNVFSGSLSAMMPHQQGIWCLWINKPLPRQMAEGETKTVVHGLPPDLFTVLWIVDAMAYSMLTETLWQISNGDILGD